MKMRIAVLTLTVLCLLGAAAAAMAVPAGVFYPNIPKGMVADWTLVGDRWNIVIDTYKTDWDLVASSARKSGTLAIFPGIVKPVGVIKAQSQDDYRNWGGSIQEAEALTESKLAGYRNGRGGECVFNGRNVEYTCNDQGWSIGRYDEGTGLFLPENIPEQANAGVMVRWQLPNGECITERVRFTVHFTDLVPVYTKPMRVKADRIELDTTGSGIVSGERDDGFLRYDLDNGGVTVETKIYAPSWLNVNNQWSAYLLDCGLESELDIDSDGNGIYANVEYKVSGGSSERKNERIDKKDWAIKWIDNSGNVAGIFGLEARFYVNEAKLTVSYDNQVEPLPRANMTWSINNPLDAYGASYDEETGEFHMSIARDGLPKNGKTNLAQTTVDIKVLVPEDAVKCRIDVLQGDVIYGDTGARLQGPMWMEDLVPGQMIEIPDLMCQLYLREIPVMLDNGKMLSYYLAPLGVGDLGGRSIVLTWYGANGKRINAKKQQITLTTDAYQITEKKSPSLTKNPNAMIMYPTLVTQESGLEMFYTQMPQMGDQVQRYELLLKDQHGNAMDPKKPVTIFLPYPEGMSQDNFVADAFAVYHQLKDGSYEEYTVKNGRLLVTPYGIGMEVSSFSPYFVNWEIAPEMSELPQTGDRSMLWLCVSMLAASIVGVAAMRMKRKTTV